MTFDPTKPVQLRDGRKAKVYEVHDNDQIHGAYSNGGAWIIGAWNLNGSYRMHEQHDADLINTPETIEGWINVYEKDKCHPDAGTVFKTKEEANKYLGTYRIACIHVSFSRGDGL